MTANFDVIVAIIILAGLAAIIWRGGSRNPVGTGALQRQISGIGSDVRALKAKLQEVASKAELDALKREIEDIEVRTASTADIERLAGELKALRAHMDGHTHRLDEKILAVKGAADRTEEGVARIEAFFLKRGIEG